RHMNRHSGMGSAEASRNVSGKQKRSKRFLFDLAASYVELRLADGGFQGLSFEQFAKSFLGLVKSIGVVLGRACHRALVDDRADARLALADVYVGERESVLLQPVDDIDPHLSRGQRLDELAVGSGLLSRPTRKNNDIGELRY